MKNKILFNRNWKCNSTLVLSMIFTMFTAQIAICNGVRWPIDCRRT